MVGLSGSGKSALLESLSGRPYADVKPTSGFAIKDLEFGNSQLNVIDLGGKLKCHVLHV